MNLITVVTPTHNRIDYLREAVVSVQQQTLGAWEHIIVDDASTDETSLWASNLSDERTKYVRMDEHGERSAALNRGLELAGGDLVLFLDDDDRLRPNSLETLLRPLARDQAAVASIGGVRLFVDGGDSRSLPHPRFPTTRVVWQDILAGWNIGRGQLLCRTDVARGVGGWTPDLILSDDFEFALRVAHAGPCSIVAHLVADKRIHEGNRSYEGYDRVDKAVRAGFVETLGPQDRAKGERALSFYDHWMTAHRLYQESSAYRPALKEYVLAARSAPELIRSLPTVNRWLPATAKAALGSLPLMSRALSGVRAVNRSVRRRAGRYPDIVVTNEDKGEDR